MAGKNFSSVCIHGGRRDIGCDNVSGLVWEWVPIQEYRLYQAASDYCASKGPGWTLRLKATPEVA
jgi:hypothetical protein